jgi:hypothetical protein
MAVGVDEASQAYQRAMRNIAPAGSGICRVCRGFIDPDYDTCYKCGHQPNSLDVMVPITYSEHLGHGQLGKRRLLVSLGIASERSLTSPGNRCCCSTTHGPPAAMRSQLQTR